ncbi:MAG TPA: MarR family winged helix-turn-helix transcriptional regulator [Acidobacteriota bacterium]|nr:MarR family winged helix-turn-helix transcriptional regulator [Acidobacteriota bacterium]
MHENIKTACHEIARLCIASRIRRLSRVITSVYDEVLRPLGITLNQLNMLVFLSHKENSSLSQIAEGLKLEISTASRNLNRLRKLRAIEVQEGKDARVREVRVSKKGKQLIVKSLPAWRKAQRKASGILAKEGADYFIPQTDH